MACGPLAGSKREVLDIEGALGGGLGLKTEPYLL